MMPHKIAQASGYVNSKNEQVKMNALDKLIYAHIKNRFSFFTKLGKEYFDTQQDIGDFFSVDVKTAGNILRRFEKDGIVVARKKPFGNFLKNVYVDVKPLRLWGGKGRYKPELALKKEGTTQEATEIVDEYEYFIPEEFVLDMPEVFIQFQEEKEICQF